LPADGSFFAFSSHKTTMEIQNEKQQEQNTGQAGDEQQGPSGRPAGSNTIKDPDDWTTGDEPMTGAQMSYLKTLSDEAGETIDDKLTKAEASKKIDELQQKTGRGVPEQGQS
jgi:hypothetical protein